MKVEIKKKKGKFNEYAVNMTGFTAGMIMAMKNALEAYPSPVGKDVLDFLKAAVNEDAELAAKIN
jgi:hypothetical protein